MLFINCYIQTGYNRIKPGSSISRVNLKILIICYYQKLNQIIKNVLNKFLISHQ